MKRDLLLDWFPVALRYGGIIGAFIFVPIVWLLTDRLEPALIAMFTLAWGVGEAGDALREFTRSAPAPPPPLPEGAASGQDGA